MKKEDKLLKNINTALEWEEGTINFDQMTGELYLLDDAELDDLYKLAKKENSTISDSINNFAAELCENSLRQAFNDEKIVKAGMDWDNPEVFAKMLEELKKCIQISQ